MAKIYNVRNGGDGSVLLGMKNATSYNVAPTTYVALPTTGLQMTLADINNYELFNVAQTSAATDLIILPAAAPQGTVIAFQANSACKVKAGATGSGLTVNGGTDATGITLVVANLAVFKKVTATAWICTNYAVAGTVTAPVPA